MEVTRITAPSPNGPIEIFRLVNARGCAVELSSLGAGIISVEVPDRDGNIANVALGYASPADYLYDGPCMGKTPGRYANRIAKGHLQIGCDVYQLATNNGPNALHGGPEGFQNQNWMAEEITDGVRFTLISPDGDEHYPGTLRVTVEYRWSDDNTLDITLSATTDRETVVNLTNHTYWNLRGADSGSVLSHLMQMRASRYLPTDETLVPTGELAPVSGTPMDFTSPKELGRDIKADFPALKFGKGYDACWTIDEWQSGRFEPQAVRISDPVSGRVLTVGTDQPGVQVYTGNWLEGSPLNRSGRTYHDYEGVAVEAQGFPDAPNRTVATGADRPAFPSQLLRPGELYRRRITYTFTTL